MTEDFEALKVPCPSTQRILPEINLSTSHSEAKPLLPFIRYSINHPNTKSIQTPTKQQLDQIRDESIIQENLSILGGCSLKSYWSTTTN